MTTCTRVKLTRLCWSPSSRRPAVTTTVTSRPATKGGGHKHHYRRGGLRPQQGRHPAKVERIEYDPNRTAHIALVCYADGERRYIIAPRNLEVGATLLSVPRPRSALGNTLPIRNIPWVRPSTASSSSPVPVRQIARSAGASANAAGP